MSRVYGIPRHAGNPFFTSGIFIDHLQDLGFETAHPRHVTLKEVSVAIRRPE